MNKITRSEADLAVRAVISNEVERIGYIYFDADAVCRALSHMLDSTFDRPWLVLDIAGYFIALNALEDGTNEDQRVNAARTVDNTDELTDYYESELTAAVNMLLDHAGFRGPWIIHRNEWPTISQATADAEVAYLERIVHGEVK